MRKTALIIMGITIFAKILGFSRDLLLSYFYGATNISDVYLIALTIPTGIFSFIGTGLSTGYIPMYSKIEKKYGLNEAERFTSNLINILIVLSSAIAILGFIFTPQLIHIFASGFKGETLRLAIQFTRISIFGICLTSIIFIQTGFLQMKGNYIIPALISIPLNICIILSIIISSRTNIILLPIGSVIATAAQVLFIVLFAKKHGYRHKLLFNFRDEHIKSMLYIILPVMLGVSVNQVNTLVDRTLASQIVEGGISALNYSAKLNGFIQGIFVISVTTVMFPTITKMVTNKNMDGLKKSLSEVISGVNLLIVPTTIGAMIFAKPIVTILFGRGAFNEQAIQMTATGLFYYSVGMIGFGLREVLSKTFYSMQDTKTPMINAAIGLALNIVLNLILSRYMGIGGLALATSIAAIFTTTLLFINLRKKIGLIGIRSLTTSFVKILCAALIMGLISKASFNYLTLIAGQNISLIISIGIGAIVYFVGIYLMRIEDVEILITALKGKLKRKAG